MPWYRVNGMMVHLKVGGRHAPKACGVLFGGSPNAQCMGIAPYLCDWPTGEGRTCDLPCCEEHAHEVGPNRHYCPEHSAANAEDEWASRQV